LTGEVIRTRREEAEGLGLEVRLALAPAPSTGDSRLVERLIANLVDNALRHNVDHGSIEVATASVHKQALLTVANTGPAVSADDLEQLFESFRTVDADRTRLNDGHGLGLSIVRAIASSHSAIVGAEPQTTGGLRVEVRFPAAAGDEPVSSFKESR
jgi:signal transduction histidine kinase